MLSPRDPRGRELEHTRGEDDGVASRNDNRAASACESLSASPATMAGPERLMTGASAAICAAPTTTD